MAIDYVLDPHLYSELPVRVRRRPHAANAVVCLSEQAVVNESRVFRVKNVPAYETMNLFFALSLRNLDTGDAGKSSGQAILGHTTPRARVSEERRLFNDNDNDFGCDSAGSD